MWAFILYVSGGIYSLTSPPNDRFFNNLCGGTYRLTETSLAGLFTLRVFARNLLRKNRRRNIFFHISFWCLTWDTKPGFMSYKPTHYLLVYGDLYIFRMVWVWCQHGTHILCNVYLQINVVLSMNESEYVVKFQYSRLH